MTTTTPDKGELLPCPFCGSHASACESYYEYGTKHSIDCDECFGTSGEYGSKEDAIAAWNRRPTNEGQDGLTDSEILTDAHRYCCKYVHADDAPYRFTERGIIEFVNLRIARRLSSKQADHIGDANKMVKADAVKMPEPNEELLNRYNAMSCQWHEEAVKNFAKTYATAHTAEAVALYQEQVRELVDGLQIIVDCSDHQNPEVHLEAEKHIRALLTKYAPKKEQDNG